jgi:hypothetical protein
VDVDAELARLDADVVVSVVDEPDAAEEVAVPAWASTARKAVRARRADALRPPATLRALAAGCGRCRRRGSMTPNPRTSALTPPERNP